ncbi:MAG: hypothetical protein HZB84_08600 [Deltaproteobacteria bacterium]|nr:hypothetical protein [Deltaproteobacteria bacterium]
MVPSVSSSVSAIKAAFTMMEASANNTANADTAGYKKDKVSLNEGKGVGVVAKVEKSNEPGQKIKDSYGNVAEASNVNYTEEAATQIQAKNMAALNVAVLKTQDEMEKNLIDIFA